MSIAAIPFDEIGRLNIKGWTMIEMRRTGMNMLSVVNDARSDTHPNPWIWLTHGSEQLCFIPEAWILEGDVDVPKVLFLRKVSSSSYPICNDPEGTSYTLVDLRDTPPQ